jgi:hypothetical protein
VNPDAPIDVAPEDNPTNEPEPDLVVLARPSREFQDANPRPGDLRLAAEILDTVAGRRLVVHPERTHIREGLYRSVTAYGEHETASPLASSHSEFRVANAFGA